MLNVLKSISLLSTVPTGRLLAFTLAFSFYFSNASGNLNLNFTPN